MRFPEKSAGVGTIALLLAARQSPRVRKVIAVNPYDYGRSGGVRKSSLTGRLVLTFSDVPILGATSMARTTGRRPRHASVKRHSTNAMTCRVCCA
jgi:hypothetical protein